MAKRRSRHYGIQRVDVNFYGDEFLAIIDKYGDEGLFAAGEILLAEAKSRAPSRRGRIRMSGYVATASRSTYVRRGYWRKERKPPKDAATIAFTAPHAHLLEGGRHGQGIIRPRKRQALRIGGEFRARPRYGRMRAKPFLGPALDAKRAAMASELAAVLGKRVNEAMPEG